MRQLSAQYKVDYFLYNSEKKMIVDESNTSCFSSLYNKEIDENNTLILKCFLCEQTKDYARIYIKRISKICGVKVKFINEDEIELTGFKNIFYVKVFTSLYRILFEVYGYGNSADYKTRTMNFFKLYIKTKSKYKDMLERLIDSYNKSECFHGPGHGITSSSNQVIPIKTIKDLQNWKCSYYKEDMQVFFKKK